LAKTAAQWAVANSPYPRHQQNLMRQMAEELLLSGQRVMPQKMLDAEYNFKFKQLANALNEIVID